MLIDDRTGSHDLCALLKRIGVPASLTRLEFADAAFLGNGPGGAFVQVGIEVKTIGDVVDCIQSGRFAAHQLPGLCREYDERWLLVEGEWRASREGLLQVRHPRKHYWYDLAHGRRRWMWRDVHNWLQTMMVLGQLKLQQTPDRTQTVFALASMYHWWTKGPWEDHSALKTFVDYKGQTLNSRHGMPALLRAPSFERRVYKELPGIGWERSVEVEQHFPNVRAAVNADERDWQRVPGVGKTIAARVVAAVRGIGGRR